MCGLTGVVLQPGPRTRSDWSSIREIIRSSLVFSEERGRDASGLAVIDAGGGMRLVKRPIPSSALVETHELRQLLDEIGPTTTCVLGHTRKPTKGSPERAYNNHPIEAGHVVGVHNGIIDNDDALFAELKVERTGEVDSEIIFRLVDDPQRPLCGPEDLAEIEARVRRLRGTFSSLSVDLRAPHRLLALKSLRPLCIHYETTHRALYFSSRYIFLRKSFGRSVITEALEADRGYVFDARTLTTNQSSPELSFPIEDRSVRAAGGSGEPIPERRPSRQRGGATSCM